ncbi:MAG: DUF5663 domain-containing protein [Patescibacteria group bacterium]
MNNDDMNKADNIEETNDIILLYQKKIMEELGLDKLSEKEKEEAEAKIANLVNNRVVNIILAYLPEEKAEEFKVLIEQEKLDEIIKFLKTTVPDIEVKIANDLMLLRKELISKLAKK